jgi:predicted alternative tryptophan synthase beta-subunit
MTVTRIVFGAVSTRPVTLIAAAAVEALEGVAVLAVGLYVGVEAVAGSPNDLASAVVLALMAVAAGVGIIAVGRGLWQARRWGRAPALLTQIFAMIAAISMIQSRRPAVGGVLVVLAVAAAVALLSPPSSRALDEDE